MSKIIMYNVDNVIIDIVDSLRPVQKNRNNIIILCDDDEAAGYIGSDGRTIYPKINAQVYTTYCDIAGYEAVEDEVVEGIEPRKYKYDSDTDTITENEDAYPETDLTLTQLMNQANANIEYIAMMSDIEL